MLSRPIKQTIARVSDSLGMRGPVTKRQVLEEVKRETPEEHWCEADRRDAYDLLLMQGITDYFQEPHSAEWQARLLATGQVPPALRPALEKLPRFMCISPEGGRGAQHVLSSTATPEQWEMNHQLKRQVVEHGIKSAEIPRDIRNLLQASGANCLMDLLSIAAE